MHNLHLPGLAAIIASTLVVLPFTAFPETASSTDERIQALEQKILILERKLEVAEEVKTAEKAKQTASISADANGFAIKSNDGNFTLKLRGVLHADGRYFIDDENVNGVTGTGGDLADQWILRRARPIIEGTLFRIFDFRFTPDFAEGKAVIQDAYVDGRFLPWLQLKAGKFKTPFGLERLQSATAISFIERALPNNLVPNRDIGAELHGDLLNGALGYSAAYLNGVTDGSSGDDDINKDKDLVGRIFAQPFLNSEIVPLQGLGIGIAATYADERGSTTNTLLPTYKSGGQNTFFSYRNSGATATFSDGERLRLSPQAYYYYGPFGLLGEYVTVSQEVRRINGAILRSEELDHDAWQIAASYLLTGNDSTFKGVKVKSPFTIGVAGWGAFELTARYSTLDVDDNAFSSGANSFADITKSATEASAWGVGCNWYLNNNIKFAANYEQTSFDGGGGGTAAVPLDRNTEQAVLTEVQLAF